MAAANRHPRRCNRPLILALTLTLALTLIAPAHAQSTSPDLAIPGGPVTAEPVVDSALKDLTGSIEIVVRLSDQPLAVANGPNSRKGGGLLRADQQRDLLRNLNQKQNALVAQVQALGGVETGRVSKALNAVIFTIDASKVEAVSNLPGVRSVRKLGEYELGATDMETVPYIGATAVQESGFDGTGVKVAVLDSGIDFTHANLGGPGTVAFYDACYEQRDEAPSGECARFFGPNAPKVKGGFDFVGETWPNGDRTEDPNPIDLEGHGTHVADIIGGRSADGTHTGVAPGVDLYGVKVCSAVASSCNGIALLRGMDFALDPNGDGSMDDAVDVINMSLGSSYGQREDDLSEASANAVWAGVVVVASAGNSADRPYIVGSPSSTPQVISVAQTQVPSASTVPLVVNSPASIAGTYTNTSEVPWAPIGNGFTGDVVFVGLACPGGQLLNNPAGKVALIVRGTCAVSLKVDTVAKAGAIGAIVYNNVPGDAPTFSFGGGDTFVPTLIVGQEIGLRLRSVLDAGGTVNVTVSPANAIGLVGGVVGSSSRGPNSSFNAIKPDIAAPGASISAVAGSGDGEEAFGGTSGAAPMVAGSAALLIQKYPRYNPFEIRALLMNTGETNIFTNPAALPGVLAPITRIGGGEVRVNRAATTTTAAWDADTRIASLSFGYQPITEDRSFRRTVRVRNYSNQARTYTITPSFRYADDANSGAITVSAPSTVRVRAGATAIFSIQLRIDAERLPTWTLNGGASGGNGALLNQHEFDGYVNIADGTDSVNVPWQILPHKAAAVSTSAPRARVGETVRLTNRGVLDGRVDVFALTGVSPEIRKALLPSAGDNFAIIDLRSVGVRQVDIGGGQLGVQFGINTFGVRAHPNYPAGFEVQLDTNNDGTVDVAIFNQELNGFGTTGQNVVFVQRINPDGTPNGAAQAFFFADADLNSGNIILTAPLSALGLSPSQQFTFSVVAFDNYFTGNVTDAVEDMVFTLATPRYVANAGSLTVPAGGRTNLTVQAVQGGDAASPSQQGLLLLYRDARTWAEADQIFVRR